MVHYKLGIKKELEFVQNIMDEIEAIKDEKQALVALEVRFLRLDSELCRTGRIKRSKISWQACPLGCDARCTRLLVPLVWPFFWFLRCTAWMLCFLAGAEEEGAAGKVGGVSPEDGGRGPG